MSARRALPAVAVVVTALILQIAYDAPVGDSLLYLLYEAAFVIAPGWLLLEALTRSEGTLLRRFALGWALGYVLEILAFMATAAIDARWVFTVYPLLVGVPALIVVLRRRRGRERAEQPDRPRLLSPWAIAAVCVLGLVYVAIAYFPTGPLPGSGSIAYFPDYPRWISLAADALHHWPITDPSVAGEPLPYHYFANIHMAAAAQVTGIDLPLIFLRLFILPQLVLAVLLLTVAGETLAGGRRAGLIAAILALLIGELRLDASNTFLAHTPFFGLFFTLVFRSPSFLLGLVLILPLLILVGERIRDGGSWRGGVGTWVAIALFMVGASDAKVTVLPLLIGALGVYGAWWLVRTRRVPVGAVIAGVLAAAVSGAVWVMQYRGHASGLGVDPFADVNLMPAVSLIKNDLMAHVSSFPGRDAILDIGGVIFGLLGLLVAPLVGIVWLIRDRGLRPSWAEAWLGSVLIAGVGASLLLAEPGTQSGMYFLFYGIVAGYLLAAKGLVLGWRRRPDMSGRWGTAAVLLGGFAALVAALIWLPGALDLFTGARADAATYALRHLGLLVAIVALWFAGRRLLPPGRWGAAALVTAALILVGALATPFDYLRPGIQGASAASSGFGKQVDPGLFDALAWIRDETPTDAVIAVDNQWIDEGNTVPLEFAYSAFAERRTFLEGWGYTQAARDRGFANVVTGPNPFAARLDLNTRAFAGDPAALRELADAGVSYIVVDSLAAYPSDLTALEAEADVVYEALGATVLRLSPN
jgi:hypothetical protein